jgi:histidyl-tRNA synthetase
MSIKAVKGMNDILPNESYIWIWLESIISEWLTSYCYTQIRTPIVESADLFLHTVGGQSDIVQKEMYAWQDSMNGDKLALRPEGTAPCLRAVIEHNLLYNSPQKLWYIGPMFRHERPQKGRYRQFHQLGVESLGFASSSSESELILMLNQLWKKLGISGLKLHINCLGNASDRIIYKEKLVEYLKQHIMNVYEAQSISEEQYLDLIEKIEQNPLRILDSKIPQLADIIKAAPVILEYLSEGSLNHYTAWKESLRNLGIEYLENPHLVRGLDYYNLSVFEWVSDHLGAQATVCGGGRYDALFNLLENKTPENRRYAAGFAIGLERLILILQEQGLLPAQKICNMYFCHIGNENNTYAIKVLNELHNLTSLKIFYNNEDLSLKNHLKKAENYGANFCVLIGGDEVLHQNVTIKNMQERSQTTIPLNELHAFFPTQHE